jgi:MFS family permease
MQSYGTLLEVMERQALINGFVFFAISLIFIAGLVLGIYLIRYFSKVKREDKGGAKWILYIGVILFSIGLVGFIIFAWLATTRLFNPSYYAIENIKELFKFKKLLELPF